MITKWPVRKGRILLMVGLAAGCAAEKPVASEEGLIRCNVPVDVVVSTATPPGFSWSPECGADRLMVEDISEPAGLYSITWGLVGGGERVPPDVRYGVVPTGTSPLGPGSALVAGREYRVRVLRYTDSGDVLLGQAVFTP